MESVTVLVTHVPSTNCRYQAPSQDPITPSSPASPLIIAEDRAMSKVDRELKDPDFWSHVPGDLAGCDTTA